MLRMHWSMIEAQVIYLGIYSQLTSIALESFTENRFWPYPRMTEQMGIYYKILMSFQNVWEG